MRGNCSDKNPLQSVHGFTDFNVDLLYVVSTKFRIVFVTKKRRRR
jgi:hypothetical protein